jgi:hypothetical protein
MVSITIAVFGADKVIRRAASIPFITGIWKSMITTSGLSSWALFTATWPFSASPQICHSVFFSMQHRSACRIRSLSSTIRILKDNQPPSVVDNQDFEGQSAAIGPLQVARPGLIVRP